MKTKAWKDADYWDIDDGIRFAVRVLRARGLDTCQSCEGGKGHAYPEPTVDLLAGSDDAQGFAALACLQEYGLPVASVALVWSIRNGLPYEKIWRITFSHQMRERANDKPSFVWGYA